MNIHNLCVLTGLCISISVVKAPGFGGAEPHPT
jgi:hypothetical protein